MGLISRVSSRTYRGSGGEMVGRKRTVGMATAPNASEAPARTTMMTWPDKFEGACLLYNLTAHWEHYIDKSQAGTVEVTATVTLHKEEKNTADPVFVMKSEFQKHVSLPKKTPDERFEMAVKGQACKSFLQSMVESGVIPSLTVAEERADEVKRLRPTVVRPKAQYREEKAPKMAKYQQSFQPGAKHRDAAYAQQNSYNKPSQPRQNSLGYFANGSQTAPQKPSWNNAPQNAPIGTPMGGPMHSQQWAPPQHIQQSSGAMYPPSKQHGNAPPSAKPRFPTGAPASESLTSIYQDRKQKCLHSTRNTASKFARCRTAIRLSSELPKRRSSNPPCNQR